MDDDFGALLAAAMKGGVTPSNTAKTWVYTPPDCDCEETDGPHEPTCPVADPAVFAAFTFEEQ